MKTKSLRGEKGQAAVFITILLMFALIALTALAIDGGHLYVVRRDLQNMTDAACLAAATELSLQGTADDAYNAAVEYILANGGVEELYTPQEGDGVGLVKGIQVSGAEVRVALQELVDTYFTMIFNRSEALVGARSRCNATAAGGLLPIAVRRYDDTDEEPSQHLDLLANKDADPRNPGASCQGVEDCPYYLDSNPVSWPGRYGPTTVYLPKPTYTPEDGPITSTTTGNIDCDVPPGDDPPVYVGICALGDGVGTNDGTADYKGFVLLDARNIVPGPVWYFNGATGQANTNKDISKRYFHSGYPGPDPMVGDQLAMLDGVSNDFAAREMAQYFNVGDEFVAVVYSGYIWDVPDLEMSIEPVVGWISPTITDTTEIVTYTVTLGKVGPSPWETDTNFALEWHFMEEGGAYGVITPTVEFSQNPVILSQWQPSVSVAMTVSVYITDTNFTSNYLGALTVGGEAIGLGLKRWASTNFGYGNTGSDFTLYANALEFNVPQGGSLDIPLTTRGFGCADGKASLSAAPDAYVWSSVFSSGQSGKIKVLDGKDSNSTFTLKVRDDAIPGWYTVRLTADPACAPAHSVDIAVYVYPPTPGSEPKRFVIVEGFAPFRVSYVDANTIGAYAIGPIAEDLSDIISGLNPRLLPW